MTETSDRAPFQIKQEVRRLSSRYLDGSLMYPGASVFTWIKLPHMPWVLASIEPVDGAPASKP